MNEERNLRKTRVGIVVSDKMDKTIVVAIKDKAKHPLYKKTINKTKKTVTTVNGEGKLVLTCLTDGVKFEGIGGRTLVDGSYSSTKSKNYSVNGMQIATTNNYDDGKWGRVELSLTGAPSHKMLNAIYVTDSDNATYYETKPITNVSKNILTAGDVEGGASICS